MSREVLVVENITKSYGKTIAVNNLSLKLCRGEILALLGPNGAGKTTTLRIIGGAIRPDKGRIIINNEDLTDKPSRRKSLMGVMTEEPSLFPDLRVRDSLIILCRLYGVGKNTCIERINYYSKYFNVYGLLGKKYGKLSMGLKRIFDYISSVIHDPAIILLDEPFNAIDVERKHLLKENIKKLRDEGKALIITSHNIPETMDLASRVVIIDKGVKVIETSPEELMAKYPIEEEVVITTKRPVDDTIKALLEEKGFRLIGAHIIAAYYTRSSDLPRILGLINEILGKTGNAIESVRLTGTPWDKIFIRIYRGMVNEWVS